MREAGADDSATARRWRRSGAALLAGLLLVVATAACAVGDSTATAPATTRLQVYFNNDRLARDPADCSAVFPVPRTVPKTSGVATAALQQLFAGPMPAEREAGYRSFFSPATAGLLKNVRIHNGTAYVNLLDLRASLSGATSSCGAAEFQSQVERTLRQFPTVRRVIYAIDGEPRTFYEWMNEPCGPTNDDCDAKPFRGGG